MIDRSPLLRHTQEPTRPEAADDHAVRPPLPGLGSGSTITPWARVFCATEQLACDVKAGRSCLVRLRLVQEDGDAA